MKALVMISLVAMAAFQIMAQVKQTPSCIVRTNLAVLDDQKKPVGGLSVGDVKIFENGVERKIVSLVEFGNGADVVFVVDNTGSVRTQLDDIASIGKSIALGLEKEDNAQIIRFLDSDKIEILVTWTKDRNSILETFDLLYVDFGATAVVDALYLATEDLIKRGKRSGGRKQVIILISDAEDRDSFYLEKDLFKLLEPASIQIFTIALAKELPKRSSDQMPNRKTVGTVVKFANKLAAKTGGTSFIFKEKSSKKEFSDSVKSLLLELGSQYVVEYVSEDVTEDNNVRKLSASVADGPNGEKRTGRVKETIVLDPCK